MNYAADGGLYAWGIAYSVQIVPRLSFGFTLNIWQDGIYQNGWENGLTGAITKATIWPDGPRRHTEYRQKNTILSAGLNANVGFLWNVTDKLALGAGSKTPFTADLRHEHTSKFETGYFFRTRLPATILQNYRRRIGHAHVIRLRASLPVFRPVYPFYGPFPYCLAEFHPNGFGRREDFPDYQGACT